MPEVATAISLWRTFTAKAELVGTAVMRTGSQDTASSLLRVAAADLRCTARVAERFPRAANSLSRTSNGRDVVAVGEFAIAETGSVALNEPDADRGACF